MQWRKLARTKFSSGRSRTRIMLCCGRRKDNGRETLDLTASPLRAPSSNSRPNHPPMVIQGDFRKVSGISGEIFKQIEAVENDHDSSTAAALEHVERRGEMIVRILELRQLGRTASEQAKRFMSMQDAKHQVQFVEIVKRPGQTLGLYIREGNGQDRPDGVFISRIALESAVYNSGCLKVGDEILAVNLVDVTHMSLDDVVIIMSIPRRLVLATRQRKGGKSGQGSPSVQPRAEHKANPVVVLKRDLREDETDEAENSDQHRDSMRQRHTGDGREMNDSSRSRLGIGMSSLDRNPDRHSQQHSQQQSDVNGLDLYYNSRPPDTGPSNWGYQPPPPVITEQPKSSQPHFPQYERGYPNTLESLAEKVHSFGMSRRMSAGGQPVAARMTSQQSPLSHYYVQHSGTGSRRIMPRSGSDQHLPHTEYTDYTSITQAGRHSLLRSSLKSGSTLSRYNQRYADQAAVAAQLQSKYTSSGGQYGTLTLRRNRGSVDYASDTEATVASRSGYYGYRDRASLQGAVPHTTIPTFPRQTTLNSGGDMATKFNSLPRDTRAAARLAMNKRFTDRNVALLQDDADGALSAPEMPSIRRDRGLIPSSPSVFSSDEYRQWLSRTPSTSAIYEQIRASRDVLNQQRAARFTYSAENIHDVMKNIESEISNSYNRPRGTLTLDRHFTRNSQPSIPARSLSTQHITPSALSSTRSPSMRRMRQLLDLENLRSGAAPSPVPTPSGTLPRGQHQLDINPAEFLKYKIDKPGLQSGGTSLTGLSQIASGTLPSGIDDPMSGMLWVHLLAGRGLRASSGSTLSGTTPVTPSSSVPNISGTTGLRDLYCVLECDRVHKARTVVRTGDLVFDWDESFELDLVNNKELDLLIYSWDPQYRHKLCYKGSVYLPTLLKAGPIHQLALKIEPRGTLYLRLRYTDSVSLYRRRPTTSLTLSRIAPIFGVDLETVVNRENRATAVAGGVPTGLLAGGQQNIPIIIKRCVEEVERRGLDIIGLYRLCGSATKKRILREAFERNSRSVDLSPDNVPDINVITGVLKDYLRELPEPLFTKCLYQTMVGILGVCLPDDPEGNAKLVFSLLDSLSRINRATLIFLMDHLALVVSASDRNKMNAQNLAIALAPPLILHSGDSVTPTAMKPNEIEYQRPITVLRYLLQIWPVPKHHSGRRGRLPVPRGNSRSASQVEASVGRVGLSRPSVGLSPLPPRSVASVPSQSRDQLPPVPSHQILGQSSVNKGLYRPLSPRVGPQVTAGLQFSSAQTIPPGIPGSMKAANVRVATPGSPSSSSDSQSGSDSVKHCLPSRVSSPAIRVSPSSQAIIMHSSPSITINSTGVRQSPSTILTTTSLASPAGPRNSPSTGNISRASPGLFGQVSRSNSPAMQTTSAGLNVTLGPSASFSSIYGQQTSNANTSSNTFGYYSQQTTYASTNPFLTGAYMSYTSGDNNYTDKFNTIGSAKEIKMFFESYISDQSKYSIKSTANYDPIESAYSTNEATKYNTIGSKFSDQKSNYLTSIGSMENKYTSSKIGEGHSLNQNAPASNSGLLNVEDTPTPTSSIETEDSTTREVGDRDVEGDGEQSD